MFSICKEFWDILNISAPSDMQFSGKVMPDKTSYFMSSRKPLTLYNFKEKGERKKPIGPRI